MNAPQHVIFFNYQPSKVQGQGEYVRYDALVIGSRDFEGNDYPTLNLVHFRHDDIAAHHALSGIDWADTLTRTLDVPHKSDVELQSFYYVCEGEESPAPAQPSSEDLDAVSDDQKAAEATSGAAEETAEPAEEPVVEDKQEEPKLPDPDVSTLLDQSAPAPSEPAQGEASGS